MADHSAIEWTGATWSPITGCTKISAGCANCYIVTTIPFRTKRRTFVRVGNESTTGVMLHPERLEPRHPLYPAKLAPRDRPIFVCSLSDLFHEAVPDEFLERVWGVMQDVPERTFQVLTKRPERALEFLTRWHARPNHRRPRPNVWVGVTVENARYTWRADVLREIPAAVRFLSCEPLLGPLLEGFTPQSLAKIRDVAPLEPVRGRAPLDLRGIDWVIAGGESGGRQARPPQPAWFRELRDACELAGVAFLFKQWGSWAPMLGGDDMAYRGARASSGGRELDGREHDGMPRLASAA